MFVGTVNTCYGYMLSIPKDVNYIITVYVPWDDEVKSTVTYLKSVIGVDCYTEYAQDGSFASMRFNDVGLTELEMLDKLRASGESCELRVFGRNKPDYPFIVEVSSTERDDDDD